MNQPLAAIANYVHAGQRLLASGKPADIDRVGTALDAALTQTLHAGRIVSGLRAFVTRGEHDREMEYLAAIVQRAVALTMPEIERHGVTVATALDPMAGQVMVDRVQIEQVLVNLIRNAAQAMRDAPRRVLSLASRSVDGVTEISVADTGAGLADTVRERLFEPFVTTRPDGTGLGLTICRAIVERHGGTLSCEAAADGGSIFRFTVTEAADTPP